MFTKLQRPALIAALVLGLLALPLAASAQSNLTFFVTGVDASKFPTVQFELRAVDLNNQPAANLNSANVSVYENGQLVPSVQVTPRADGAVNLIYVIDLGRLSNFQFFGLNNVRLAITTLVSGGYFVDGVDSVQVLGRQNINSDQTITLLPATSTGSELTSWAANFNFQRGNNRTKGLLGVEDAISAMSQQVPIAGSRTTAIIYITRYIEDPTATVSVSAAQSLAQKAKQQHISLYTFQTDFGQTFDQALRVLASGATGEYVHLQRNTVATSVDRVYQGLNGQRTVYTVTYRSTLGSSGTRHITVNSAQVPSAGVTGSYDVTVLPATVNIVKPVADSTIRREATLSGDGKTYTYATNTVSVAADIAWPDASQPRAIKTAQLFVDGALQDSAQPEPGATQVQFVWDVSDIIQEGINPARLEVRVTDELSVEATGLATVKIEVVPPPPAEPESPWASLWAQYWVILPIACVGLLVVGVVGAVIYFFTRPAPTAPAPAAAEGQHTLIVGSATKQKALATLKVLEGPKGLIGETISITKPVTVIGRNAKTANVVFYPNEESSVSRTHCTIQIDGKYFLLTDNNSANGTRINGELLKANDPVQLRDGDEIVLGDLAKLGVKLIFNVQPGAGEKRGAASIDRTFIIDEWDEDELDKYKG